MTTSRKTSRARTATSREEDTMMLQCIQALFDMQGTGLKAPESLNDCADKSKLAKAVAQYQAENGGSILAAMGAVWFKKAAEMLMESELAAHLGYNKYERLPNQSNDTPEIASDAPSDVSEGNGRRKGARNYRNGSYPRKMHTSGGTIEVDCPRDRKGTFASAVFPKGVKDVTGLQEKLLSLVAQGNDLRSAARIVEELMGVKVSHEYVHMTVENFSERLHAWQKRQLKPFYPFLFIDCLYVPFRDDKLSSKDNKRPVYVVLGIDADGRKELVHLEMRGACESKQDWVNIFDGLRSRGLEELLFVSMDGVTGVADGLKVIYPNARTFRCIVHMIRNSCRHIGYKERKEWCADIKPLYSSPDLASAEAALRALENKWKASNPAAVKFWVRNFDEFVAPLYSVTSSIRKVIYTTNAVESLNSSLRTVVQKGAYSSEKAILTSMLLRCEKGLASNWRRRAIPNWTKIREELMAIEEYEELCIRYMDSTGCQASR